METYAALDTHSVNLKASLGGGYFLLLCQKL